MRKKLFSILALLMVAVTGAWADITITWGSAELSSLTDDQLLAGATKTVNGITVTVNAGSNNFLAVSPVGTMFSATNDNAFTFSTELGNFTKIECTSLYLSGTLGDGWDGATWTGDANSVNMSNAGSNLAVSSITFTIGEPAAPAGYAVSLKAETADEGNWTAKAGEGDYQSLPLEGVAEGTQVTLTYSGLKKVKSVKAVKKAPAAGLTSYTLAESTVGMIVGTDGKAYDVADLGNLPSGVTAAGVVVYKNGANGLAIALTDEASMMDWATACGESGAAAHTPTVEGQTWKLPSQEEWTLVKNANSGTSLNSAITSAGGTAIPTVHFDHETQIMTGKYWLSTEGGFAEAARTWGINGYDEIAVDSQDFKTSNNLVRAIIVF